MTSTNPPHKHNNSKKVNGAEHKAQEDIRKIERSAY